MLHRLRRQKILLLLLALGVVAQSLAAEQFYRYRDDRGVLVLDYQVPPHLVKNGYEVVSASGQVLEIIPPYREQTEEARLAAERAEQQALEDQVLLKSYSSLDELYSARDRKLEGLQREIDIITTNITESNALLDSVRAKAANLQRSGRVVRQSIVDQIDSLVSEITDGKRMLTLRRKEYNEVSSRYERYAERLKVLLGGRMGPQQTGPQRGAATGLATSPSGGG